MTSTLEKLNHLLTLLKIEKEEDIRLYREMVLEKTLTERVKKGITWYPLSMKRLYVGLGDKIVIELEDSFSEKNKSGVFQAGDPVSIFGNASDQEMGRNTGVIASIRKGVIRIALNSEQIPDWITSAKLGIDPEFDDKTYLEMERAIRQVMEPGKNRRLAELREILSGDVVPEFHKWKVTYQNPTLNPSQNRAVQKVLEAHDVAIIHGPPGTGKTTTLVQAIKEVLLHENQVLVCAPSNTAVDLLALKCHQEGISVARIGNPVRVEEALQDLTIDGLMASHEDYPALRKLRKEAEAIKTAALKFKRNFGGRERQQRQELMKEARELKNLSHQLEDYILFQILSRTQVITSTLAGAANSILGEKRFHTVFIDEAAQAMEPAAWIPILRSNRVIMAGDHCQLPPTVKSVEANRGGLSHTLFESIIEQKEVDVMLDRQYRMNEKIMRFSGKKFYDNQLHADDKVHGHQLGPEFLPVEFVDTAGCGFEEMVNPETRSRGNPDEANLLLKHLATLFNQISNQVPEILNPNFTIGIISPYKEQVRIITSQIQNSPMLSEFQSYLSVNTIDGFQGQERDVIYISLVRSNEKNEIGFLKDIRRMNVALTRARKKLVVVGDSSTLGNDPFYHDFLDYIEEIGAYHSAWEWMHLE
ncbi:MAG: AAA domain-containing protein [Bacteroidia bacterium]|nr:AAA domain-containing protein [Bacteroidia bacterium]